MSAKTKLPTPNELTVELTIQNNGKSATLPEVLNKAPNLALLYQRYLPAHGKRENGDYRFPLPCGTDFSAPWMMAEPETDAKKKGKRQNAIKRQAETWSGFGVLNWFATQAAGGFSGDILQALSERRQALLAHSAAPHRSLQLKTLWRCATGLGNPSPCENAGWAFHHTYGFPILPAASLKGVARHYLAEEYTGYPSPEAVSPATRRLLAAAAGALDIAPEKMRAKATTCSPAVFAGFLFGDSAGEGAEGVVAFHDGWPVPATAKNGWFEVDVLTSHHQKYYGDQQDTATDSDNPNPVFFPTLKAGVAFDVHLSLTRQGRELPVAVAEGALAFTRLLLRRAAENWGVGAKTGSGYGLLKGGA